jgi:flagellin-like protein
MKYFGNSRKGLTPIIAIIILLLITVALAGAAYSYMTAYWSSLTGDNIMVISSFCTGGNTANILVRNAGTSTATLANIVVLDTLTNLPVENPDGSKNWTSLDGTEWITTLDPGETGKFNATCTDYCIYRFIYGGAIGSGSEPTPVAC